VCDQPQLERSVLSRQHTPCSPPSWQPIICSSCCLHAVLYVIFRAFQHTSGSTRLVKVPALSLGTNAATSRTGTGLLSSAVNERVLVIVADRRTQHESAWDGPSLSLDRMNTPPATTPALCDASEDIKPSLRLRDQRSSRDAQGCSSTHRTREACLGRYK
jgi:hypothetical protein